MDAERWRIIESLFDRTADLPAHERRGFLESQVKDDASVVEEILALTGAHDKHHPILDGWQAAPLPSGMRLGPWAIDRVLGAGGMGTVYLAHRADRQFDRKVAIKLLSSGLRAAIHFDRFHRERHLLAVLEHPNIARLLDSGVNEFGQPYLVMEWVDGDPLDVWCTQTEPDLERRLEVWIKIATAVSYAHRHLIVHRDLKPSNVLVTRDGEPKLLDFGIARMLDEAEVEATRTAYLTPRYASPEQIAGKQVSTASDIYSLGVVLAELITGNSPESATTGEIAAVSKDLAAIVGMALRTEPERRYATVDQFMEDVRRYQRRLPVTARPESWGYRAGKFVQRHRFGVAFGSAAVACLLILTVIALLQVRKTERQRARAEKVSEFLAGIMGATPDGTSDSLRGRGVSLRVVDLVNTAAARVDREFANDPEAEATVRYVIGSTYWQMGLFEDAARHAKRGVELAQQFYEPTDPRLFNIRALRSLIAVELGHFKEAEEELLDVRRGWKDPPAFAAANVLSTLGIAQLRLGKLDAAEATLKESLAQLEKGGRTQWLGLVISNLSLIYLERGQYDRALPLLQRAVGVARESAVGHSEALGWALTNVANVQRILGNHAEALAAAEEAYRNFAATIGESNQRIANAAVHIASAKALLGDPVAGELALRKVMVTQRALPSDHFERGLTLSFLGLVLMHQNRLADAAIAATSALEIRRKAFKSPNWRIAETAGLLGEILAKQGKRDTGRPLLEESLTTFTTLYGGDNVRTREARERLERWAPIESAAR